MGARHACNVARQLFVCLWKHVHYGSFGRVPCRLGKSVEVMFEGRTIPVVNGSFTDGFEEYDAHVYRF
eukprot:SAG11_NODE_3229_length_2596_cov_1.746496_3_plen_68_part_00